MKKLLKAPVGWMYREMTEPTGVNSTGNNFDDSAKMDASKVDVSEMTEPTCDSITGNKVDDSSKRDVRWMYRQMTEPTGDTIIGTAAEDWSTAAAAMSHADYHNQYAYHNGYGGYEAHYNHAAWYGPNTPPT